MLPAHHFVEMLEIRIADFGGDDFDREVGVAEEFLGPVGAEATQPGGGGLAGLLLEDAGELVVGDLATSREFPDGGRAGHFLHDDFADGFDDALVRGGIVGILKDVLNAEKHFP